jgi:hypothetical protein
MIKLPEIKKEMIKQILITLPLLLCFFSLIYPPLEYGELQDRQFLWLSIIYGQMIDVLQLGKELIAPMLLILVLWALFKIWKV